MIKKLVSTAVVAGLALVGCEGSSSVSDPVDDGGGDGETVASVSVVSGDNQTGAPGETLADPFVVSAEGADGQPLSNVTVVWSITSSEGGSLSAQETTTNDQGQTQVTATLPNTEDATLTVEAAASDGSASTTLTANTTSGDGEGGGGSAAADIQLVSGDGQKGMIRRTLADPLVVEVTDSAGVTVEGAAVNWRVVSGTGGSVSDATVQTGDQGRAESGWRLGDQPGADSVIAWIEPAEADPDTVEFTADVTGTPDTIVIVQGAIEEDGNATQAPETVEGDTVKVAPGFWSQTSFQAEVRDSGGRTVHGAELTWTVTDGGGTVGDVPEGSGNETVIVNTAVDGSLTVWRRAPEGASDGTWIGATLSLEAFPGVDPVTLDALVVTP